MLWLIDHNPPYALTPADLATSLAVTAIAAGLMDPPDFTALPALGKPSAKVIDLEVARQAVSDD